MRFEVLAASELRVDQVRVRRLPPRAGWLLTWSGIRGGISVALALSLPAGPERDTILTLTYSVVVFSILVQGLTIGALARRLGLVGPAAGGPHRA